MLVSRLAEAASGTSASLVAGLLKPLDVHQTVASRLAEASTCTSVSQSVSWLRMHDAHQLFSLSVEGADGSTSIGWPKLLPVHQIVS